MPVVINEFELATEPPRRAEEAPSAQRDKDGRSGPATPQAPEALACALRALSRRAARLRAD